MNEIHNAIGELITRCVYKPCAECGNLPHGAVQVNLYEPLEAGDWEGMRPLCDDCWNDYYQQCQADQSERWAEPRY